jgi:hypothetical protein
MCNSFASARETTTSLPAIVHLVIITPVYSLLSKQQRFHAGGRLLPATDEQQKNSV